MQPHQEISVGVVTMGRPDSLAGCLRAIGRGTVLPLEVIVVDQAPSPESRRAVVEARGALRVVHLERPPLGVSGARNLALATASGTVIAYTDDDCEPDPTWLEAIVAAFTRQPEPVAVTGRVLTLGPRPPGGVAVSLRTSPDGRDYRGRLLPSRLGTGGNLAVQAAALRRLGGWDERLGPGTSCHAAEDVELLYRMASSGARVRYEPAAIVRHAWQQRSKRLATRWTYGYGYGVLCGMVLRRGERFGLRMLLVQARFYVRAASPRSLAGLTAGLLRGLRMRPRQR